MTTKPKTKPKAETPRILPSYVVKFLKGRRTYYKADLDDYSERQTKGPLLDPEVAGMPANLVSSEMTDKISLHKPVFDIDVEALQVPSSTPGHSHLYFDVAISWDKYVAVMDAMAAAGLCDAKWVQHCKDRRKGLVRPPWASKSDEHGDMRDPTWMAAIEINYEEANSHLPKDWKDW